MAKGEATLLLKVKQTGAKSLKSVRDSFNKLKSVIKVATVALLAWTVAVIKFAEAGSRFKEVQNAFRKLAFSQGQDADAMLKKMRELSKGTISDLELMKNANQALLLGLPVERFGDMLKIARSSAKATGQSMEFMLTSIVTGLGRGSKLILDNLGIMIDTNAAYERFARTNGLLASELTEAQRKQAFLNEALRIGVENADKMGETSLSLTDRFAQLKANAQNIATIIGGKLGPSFGFLLKKAEGALDTIKQFGESKNGALLFRGLTFGVAGVIVAFKDLGAIVGNAIGGIVDSFTAISERRFKDAGKALLMIQQETINDLAQNHKEFNEDIKQINDDFDAAEKENEELLITEKQLRDQQAKLKAIKDEKTHLDKMAKLKKAADERNKKADQDLMKLGIIVNKQKVADMQGTLGTISTLQSSHNKGLAAIGKAAAIAQITISTAQGIGKAWELGPILGPILAPLVAIAGAAQIAKVSGVQLADGGIVQARAGGTPAIIGEGGRDEAVIPLDDDTTSGSLSNNITINVGAFMGDEDGARQFAMMIDEQLFSLRQSNESVSFDRDII